MSLEVLPWNSFAVRCGHGEKNFHQVKRGIRQCHQLLHLLWLGASCLTSGHYLVVFGHLFQLPVSVVVRRVRSQRLNVVVVAVIHRSCGWSSLPISAFRCSISCRVRIWSSKVWSLIHGNSRSLIASQFRLTTVLSLNKEKLFQNYLSIGLIIRRNKIMSRRSRWILALSLKWESSQMWSFQIVTLPLPSDTADVECDRWTSERDHCCLQ